MTEPTKRRGRPIGSEKDDRDLLVRIAARIVQHGEAPTTAMRRIKRDIGDSEVRRLQTKWKVRKDALLDTARLRLAQERADADARAARRAVGRELAAISEPASIAAIAATRKLMPQTASEMARAAMGLGPNSAVMAAAMGLPKHSALMRAAMGMLPDTVMSRYAQGIDDSILANVRRCSEEAARLASNLHTGANFTRSFASNSIFEQLERARRTLGGY